MTSAPVVVADTSPINHLILIGHVAVLPAGRSFFRPWSGTNSRGQRPRSWCEIGSLSPPAWLEVRSSVQTGDPSLADLDDGERSAILLAMELHADLLLIDGRRAAKTARSKGFRVAGTLAILGMAARRDLLSLPEAIDRLKQTSFHYSQEVLEQFLAEQDAKA